MVHFNAHYYVIVGNYGSGKPELSLALARRLRRETVGRVALVEMVKGRSTTGLVDRIRANDAREPR